MAVRQYIGAKYVPHGWTDWNAQTLYDPLYIVKYNLGWYILKKPLPQAGVLPTNEEYWALVDNWNGQVEEYRQEVEEVKNQIAGVYANDIPNRYFLFFGDSYLDPEYSTAKTMVEYFIQGTNIPRENVFQVYRAGAVMADMPALIQSWMTANPSLVNKITDVVGVLGKNDFTNGSTVNQIEVALRTIRGYFPKATLWNGMSGCGINFPSLDNQFACSYKYYVATIKVGGIWIQHLSCPLLYKPSMQIPNGAHPTDSGNHLMGNLLSQVLRGGSSYFAYDYTLTGNDFAAGASGKVDVLVTDTSMTYNFELMATSLTFVNAIANLPNLLVNNPMFGKCRNVVNLRYKGSDGNVTNSFAILNLNGLELQLQCLNIIADTVTDAIVRGELTFTKMPF